MALPLLDDVTVEVTNRCQLHCRACGIWREPVPQQITLKRFKGMMTSLLGRFRIASVSVTGGEPFCHNDIGSILRYLAGLRARKKIKSFGVYTNGAMTAPIAAFLKRNAWFLAGMSVGISIDGDAAVHDRLRGKGAFACSMATLDLVSSRYAGVILPEVKFTLSAANYRTMAGVYALARSHGASFSPKIVEPSVASYYHRQPTPGAKAMSVLTPMMIAAVRRQGREILKQEVRDGGGRVDVLMMRLFLQLLSGKVRAGSCQTPGRCLFITSRGEIHPCLYMPPAGKLLPGGGLPASVEEARADRAERGVRGDCPGCLAYHGYMKHFNVVKDKK